MERWKGSSSLSVVPGHSILVASIETICRQLQGISSGSIAAAKEPSTWERSKENEFECNCCRRMMRKTFRSPPRNIKTKATATPNKYPECNEAKTLSLGWLPTPFVRSSVRPFISQLNWRLMDDGEQHSTTPISDNSTCRCSFYLHTSRRDRVQFRSCLLAFHFDVLSFVTMTSIDH